MIVETSALLAILRQEPAAGALVDAINQAGGVRMSAASYLEASVVVRRLGDAVLSRRIDDVMTLLEIEIVAFDERQARLARAGYDDFGRWQRASRGAEPR